MTSRSDTPQVDRTEPATTEPEAKPAAAEPVGTAPFDFDRVTRVRPAGDGRTFDAQIDPRWSIAGKPNGGYLLVLCARAALATLAQDQQGHGPVHDHVVAASVTYLSAAPFEAVRIEVDLLRRGRSTSVLRSRLVSADGETRVEATLTCGHLREDAAPFYDGVTPPDLPPVDRCVRLPVDGPGFQVPLMGVVAEHLDPATLGWATGAPSGQGELRGHLLFDDGRPADPLSLLLAVDALPPATFDLGLGGWVPTMQLTAWVRAVPAPGPLVVRQTARLVEAHTVDETCDVWDSRGRLVATGHQFAAVRTPRG